MLRAFAATLLVLLSCAPLASALPPPSAYADMNFSVRNDGENAAGLPTEDSGFVSVVVDPANGIVFDVDRTDPTADGLLAYLGFLTGGQQGIAGIWGEVTVDGTGCSYQTWGGENVDPALEPRVDCLA